MPCTITFTDKEFEALRTVNTAKFDSQATEEVKDAATIVLLKIQKAKPDPVPAPTRGRPVFDAGILLERNGSTVYVTYDMGGEYIRVHSIYGGNDYDFKYEQDGITCKEVK